jgi:dipeptidase E
MINLHLLSTPGDRDIAGFWRRVVLILRISHEPTVAFMPQASLKVDFWMDYTVRAFEKLAQIECIDTGRWNYPPWKPLSGAPCGLYLGGNTFLLNHRLHASGLMPYLRKKVQAGLPVVGFSAGMIVCGPNILTAKDLNSVETIHFSGLNASPFNFVAHYAADFLRPV